MKKQIVEKSLFLILNLVLSSGLAQFVFLIVASATLGEFFGGSISTENDWPILWALVLLILVLWIFKIVVFTAIYVVSPKQGFIKGFLTRFLDDRKFRFLTLLFALILDIIILLISTHITVLHGTAEVDFREKLSDSLLIYLITLGGVTTCWVAFWLAAARFSPGSKATGAQD